MQRTVESRDSERLASEFLPELVTLIAELAKAGLVLKEDSYEKLGKLSVRSLEVTAYFVAYFIRENILSESFVMALIDKLSIKLLPAESCEMTIDKSARYFKLDMNGVTIAFQLHESFMHHYWSGHPNGHDQQVPQYLLKFSHESSVAYKEAKYCRFFREYSRWVKNSEYFFTSWVEGKSLSTLQRTIEDYSDHVRLIWLCSLLEKLTQLHQIWRAHLDLSSGNIIINTEKNEAAIIDFESAVKVRNLEQLHEDLVDLSTRILPVLFPNIDYYRDEQAELYQWMPAYFVARQMYVRALGHDKLKPIFTSKQALAFCQHMLHEFDSLNVDMIKANAEEMLAADAKTEACYLLLK